MKNIRSSNASREVIKMPGYNPREKTRDRESGAEFLDDMLEEMEDDSLDEFQASAPEKKRSGKHGEYLRKIEQLREEKALRDHLADYDWDDI